MNKSLFSSSKIDRLSLTSLYTFFCLRWMCNLSNKIGVKAYDIILERQRLHSGPQKCFNDDEVIKICTTMLESGQVNKMK